MGMIDNNNSILLNLLLFRASQYAAIDPKRQVPMTAVSVYMVVLFMISGKSNFCHVSIYISNCIVSSVGRVKRFFEISVHGLTEFNKMINNGKPQNNEKSTTIMK